MTSVSYRMSGSGNWQNLLPDEFARRLYADIYPRGTTISKETDRLFRSWQRAGIADIRNHRVIPRGPIMTEGDLTILQAWFQNLSDVMCRTVSERLHDYRDLAEKLTGGLPQEKQTTENILTILICARTLDSWMFSMLRRDVIGPYPSRGDAGDFFFWGYAFSEGPQRIFGFTTYGGRAKRHLHMIRSHSLDREAIKAVLNRLEIWDVLYPYLFENISGNRTVLTDRLMTDLPPKAVDLLKDIGLLDAGSPPRLAIPLWTGHDRDVIAGICREVSQKVHHHFMAVMDELERLHASCSFADCSRPDCLCMIFHLAYAYAADKLVAEEIIPDFPQKAGGEWGVWID
ncbi:MAG: hypothetical protein JXA41_00245 [Deltaproteobacteria bacterium]|nr:hypothetical protein [Deltaproteobacteria bacterium]